ncbi:MAG: ABC transporter ATP-binding protein [Planctomycetota bacterium]
MPDTTHPIFELDRAAKLHEADPPRGLHGTTLRADNSQTIALIGPNGAGKSTLLHLLSGTHAPTAGSVRVLGQPAGRSATARSSVGMVFQTHALDTMLTVRENLRLFAALHGLANANTRVDELIEQLDLGEHAGRRVGKLSGGLTRRADLARAMLHQPRLLLLDEPTTGLDPAARHGFVELLLELPKAENGPAVLWSTHLLDEAQRADRVLILNDGRILRDAPPSDLTAALGTRVLRTNADNVSQNTGLTHTSLGNESLLAASNADALAPIADDLNTRGVAYALAPPSLRDAYDVALAEDTA